MPWEREGDGQGGALSFGCELRASEPQDGFFPNAQRLVLWLTARATPALGAVLGDTAAAGLGSAGAAGARLGEGRWGSSMVALLKVLVHAGGLSLNTMLPPAPLLVLC